MSDAPRDDLIRAAGEPMRADSEGRTLTGYPIVFNDWTEINSYEGNFKERISPGALNKTLRESQNSIKVLFNHGMDPDIGDKPLGKPSVMRADEKGLYVEVPLSDTSYNNDLLALMRDGALDGQSFRFAVVKDEWETPKRGLPERTINELRLYEFGPVTFPAYDSTTVGVRSRDDYIAWRALTDEKRNEIRRICGISDETNSTPTDEAAEGTSLDESRETPQTEPSTDTPAAPIPPAHRQTALRALRLERAKQSGVFTDAGQDSGGPVAA